MTTQVKLLNIAGLGPLLALPVDGGETATEIAVRFPAQLGMDGEGNIQIVDYLDGLVDFDQATVFMKANIVSVNVPAASLAETYVEAIKGFVDSKPKVIVPEQKIIL